jgi:protein-tyrosine phosphatase
LKIFFVTKRLAFGSAIRTRSDVERLKALGVTHVINLRRYTNSKKVKKFKWLWLPFSDDKQPRPDWFYRKAHKFYRKASRKRRNKVFVMCHHGISRSPSLTYFLLRCDAVTPNEAKGAVRTARPRARLARVYVESTEAYLRRTKLVKP